MSVDTEALAEYLAEQFDIDVNDVMDAIEQFTD